MTQSEKYTVKGRYYLNISAVAISEKGATLARQLQHKSDGKIASYLLNEMDLEAWIDKHFILHDALILVSSIEQAVTLISPFIKANTKTPSVVVIDETERFVIPILSGTHGLANDIANAVSTVTNCFPVITTMTNSESIFSIDNWANSVGLKIANPENTKYITAKLISRETVHFETILPICDEPPKGMSLSGPNDFSDFIITYLSSVPDKVLHLVPPVLTLGIHCQNNSTAEEIESTFEEFLKECGCHPLAIREVCTLDIEKQIPGLVEFCSRNKLPLKVFNTDDISSARIMLINSKAENECEQCAVLGSNGTLFVRKMQINNISLALSIIEPC